MHKKLPIKNGSKVAVIGAGPAGCFFTIFLQRLAQSRGISLDIVVFDGKPFTVTGPRGCNMCAGVISRTLSHRLEKEGIFIPDIKVQRKIKGYCLQTQSGEVFLKEPEEGIISVFRGNGPRYWNPDGNISFDDFLLHYAKNIGATICPKPVRGIDLCDYGAIIRYGIEENIEVMEADAVVCAFGLNARLAKKIQDLGFGYIPPDTVNACQAEIPLDPEYIKNKFQDHIFIYNMGAEDVRFAALIPKKEFITVTVIGAKDITKNVLINFLRQPEVLRSFPPDWDIPDLYCHCHPKIATSSSKHPFTDRMVVIGDASYSRFYKNGIESALSTAYYAADTIINNGISGKDFEDNYYKRCKKAFIYDNIYGKILMKLNDIVFSNRTLTEAVLDMAHSEKMNENPLRLHRVLWNMFTGEVPYRDIMVDCVNPALHLQFFRHVFMQWSRK